ncbi:hypothetical protein RGQ29_017868 [Quercus rubra]|uniref:PB1 domain-containing protein n=1 Tax=Quercus rubra TaxID=3512 RepID=A0AAN7FHG9_QUERU|nr:hypothetical protein RGQ29_017868 [Quercus rubra]
MPSSVLSSDSMHIGLLAAAAHAAATNSRFTIFYNPRASPSEFVIPLAKYVKAVYHTRVSVGMRFRMLFETEESSVRRYMGTITGISDLDPVRWRNSHWRSVKVGWDESTAGERQPRVSLWEIEPLTTFPMYPSSFPLRLKRPWPSGLPSFHSLKDGDISISSPLMWLQGGLGDQGIQSLNFQGFGVTPLMQPRFDSSILGPQPDVYQAMAAAALQEMRTVDPSKCSSQSLLQLQQSQNVSNGPNLIQRQMLQQPQSQNSFIQSFQENQLPTQAQLLQQQVQRYQPYNNQRQQQQQQQQLQQSQQLHHLSVQQQIPNVISAISNFASATQSQTPSLQSIPSQCQQQCFPDPVGNPISTSDVSPIHSILGSLSQDGASYLHNLNGSNPAIASSSMLPKQIAVEPQLPSGAAQCVLPQVEQLGTPQSNVSELAILPPFPGREYSGYQGATDPQSNLLFGVNIDSSSLMLQNGMANLRDIGSESDSLSMPFSTSNFTSATGTDFPLNSDITTSSCVDESSFLQSSENVDQVNPPTRTFVKVHKSGSFGRSLDISKFSSYDELRSELAHMFGLEGQLEDPQRSGWQLVFVDRENDVLLLGDDPWQEFVNNVWYIKILSPVEVRNLGKEGIDLATSAPSRKLSNSSSSCDDYVSRRDLRNSSNGIAAMGSLDY